MDYTQQIDDIYKAVSSTNEILGNIAALLVVFVIILLCYFAYKFFNMFF